MQVQAGRDCSFYKGLAQAVLTENDQGDGTLDARAAPRVFSHGIAINQRRLAHVCSIEMPPDASSSTRLSSAKNIFSAARQKLDLSANQLPALQILRTLSGGDETS